MCSVTEAENIEIELVDEEKRFKGFLLRFFGV